MTTLRKLTTALSIAALCTASALAAAQPYTDKTRGFVTAKPDKWSAFNGGMYTASPDSKVRCTVSVQPNQKTAAMSQGDVNAEAAAYFTPDLWEQQFFVGGASGEIADSGFTMMDAYNAAWANGTVEYPNSAEARFEIVTIQAPGKNVSATCVGEPGAYEANKDAAKQVLNSLRPA